MNFSYSIHLFYHADIPPRRRPITSSRSVTMQCAIHVRKAVRSNTTRSISVANVNLYRNPFQLNQIVPKEKQGMPCLQVVPSIPQAVEEILIKQVQSTFRLLKFAAHLLKSSFHDEDILLYDDIHQYQ